MQDLNDLIYFAEVVDRGSFSAAGRSLGIPKSRLSRRIAELESRMGVRLLQRTTRKLSVTDVGEQVHRHCVAMRDDARAAENAAIDVRSEPRGLIRIACPVTLAQTTIGPLLPLFLNRYPQVRVDMRVSNRVVDLIEEGFDIALRVRPTLDDSGSLVIRRFGATRASIVASPLQLKRQMQPQHPEDLRHLDTVSMSATDGRTTWHLTGPDQASFDFTHQPRFVADDLLTLKFAIAGGTGICAIPDYLCSEELRSGQLVRILPGWAPKPGIFHAVFPSRRGLVPAVRHFLDFLADSIEREGVILAG